MKVCYGSTRTVFLIGRYAIKIPSVVEWRLFLHGLLANIQEKTLFRISDKLCPVIFSFPLGICIIMERCDGLTLEQFGDFNIDNFRKVTDCSLDFIENKMDSFGILNGKIVAVDYGN